MFPVSKQCYFSISILFLYLITFRKTYPISLGIPAPMSFFCRPFHGQYLPFLPLSNYATIPQCFFSTGYALNTSIHSFYFKTLALRSNFLVWCRSSNSILRTKHRARTENFTVNVTSFVTGSLGLQRRCDGFRTFQSLLYDHRSAHQWKFAWIGRRGPLASRPTSLSSVDSVWRRARRPRRGPFIVH